MTLLITPHIITGTATDVNSNAIANRVIILTNLNSSETQTFTSTSSGEYIFDCGNFASGYADGDKISLSLEEPTFEIYVSHNAGLSWYQVDNEEEYTFDINAIRVQVDKTNFPGGRTGIKLIYPI